MALILMIYINKFQKIIKSLLSFEDKVFYSFLYRASQAFVGITTIFLITYLFQPIEQGYYYTFNSLIALQIIFEMGLSFVILQFSGHEFAVLSWTASKEIQGPKNKLAEFSVFVAKCCKTYALVAVLAFIIIWCTGIIFFANTDHTHVVNWKWPWLLLCLATMGNLFFTPFLAIIEGSGQVKKVNQFKAIQNTLGALVMWIAMMGKMELYSIGLDILFCVLLTSIWLWKNYRCLFFKVIEGMQLSRSSPALTKQWSEQVWPMQWRIGISWIAGYFLNQIYTPIIFYYHGAVAAGKLGMSLSVCNMISLFSITILTAYNPQFCQLIANQHWLSLKQLFSRLFLQSLTLTIIGSCVLICLMQVSLFDLVSQRLVSVLQMSLLLMGVITNFIIGSIALFLRSFKKEPFVWVSLAGAIMNASLSWWFGKYYSITGICAVYFLLNFVYGLPTAWMLWRKNTANLWLRAPHFLPI